MAGRASIAIVEDHVPTSLLWARVVRRAGWRCAGRFLTAERAAQILLRFPPDLVLLDLELPGHPGDWLAAQLHARHPAVRILMITAHDEIPVLRTALRVPVHGFLAKPLAPAELGRRIREVLTGRMPLHTQHGAAILPPAPFAPGTPGALLSPREREIIKLGIDGCTAKEMAGRLGVSVHTINVFRERIVDKLDAHNFTQAVFLAAGLPGLQPPGP